MERLTTRYADHAALKLKKDIGNWCISTDGQKGDYSIYGDAVERLATYEDAEQDGRLVALPCKVGDTLYSATCGKIRPFVVAGFELYGTELYVVEQVGLGREHRVYGKTAFLTREEAEDALKGGAE